MINAFLLLLNPVATWERIASARRSVLLILAVNVLPLLLLVGAIEVWGLVHWGKPRSHLGHALPLPMSAAVHYGIIKLVAQLTLLFLAAFAMSAIGKSFRARQTYTQAFTLVAFALMPYFTAQILHALPWFPGWIIWAGGVVLTCAPLYQGVPNILEPDPPQTFGLYLMGVIALAGLTGLAQFICNLVLRQQIMAVI